MEESPILNKRLNNNNEKSLLTSSSIKKNNQLQRLVNYTANQKTKQAVKFKISNDEAILSNHQRQPEQEEEMPQSDYSLHLNRLSSYHGHIIRLNNQLNAIKNNILMNSKDLLALEQERLQEALDYEDKQQKELLRHQLALQKHNQFMKEQHELIKPKEKLQFL